MLKWLIGKSADRAADTGRADAQAVKEQGDEHLRGGRYADAERCFREALALNPGLVDAQLSLSRLLLETAQFEAAEVSYRREIALIPEHFGPHHQLGVVLSLLGRHEDAIEQ